GGRPGQAGAHRARRLPHRRPRPRRARGAGAREGDQRDPRALAPDHSRHCARRAGEGDHDQRRARGRRHGDERGTRRGLGRPRRALHDAGRAAPGRCGVARASARAPRRGGRHRGRARPSAFGAERGRAPPLPPRPRPRNRARLRAGRGGGGRGERRELHRRARRPDARRPRAAGRRRPCGGRARPGRRPRSPRSTLRTTSRNLVSNDAFEIRPVRTIEEAQRCVALQKEVWGPSFTEIVPPAILWAAQKLGGVTAAAYDAEGTLAGFVFGITGFEDGRLVHWSDMLAVRPDLRDRGLGARLKRYQRDALLPLGVQTVYWTFDPLESKNAYLNFGRLGIIAREYHRDFYGR